MSDLFKKAEELEAKLRKIADGNSTPVKKTAMADLTTQKNEDDKRAQELAKALFAKMAGPVGRQPTDQEMFGHLVPSEDQVKAAEDQWSNGLNKFFNEVRKPIEKQSALPDFGRRGPVKESDLTEEEQRIRKIAVDPRLTEGD
jgi:isochorismate hydrolase